MIFHRLINCCRLNSKIFNQNVVALQSMFISYKTCETGQAEDKMLYERISKSYDKLNDVITLGQHRYWRRSVINNIPITEDSQILDAPGGTGLNAMRLLERSKKFSIDSNFCVTVYDINPVMMKVGQDKQEILGYNKKFIRWIEGDIQKLPFADGTFDTYLMFFGIRQNIDFDQTFKEANRVLKPNGKIVIGELCYSQDPAISQWLYLKFIQYVVSKFVYLFFNNTEASKYLLKNLINLPSRNQTIAMLEGAGFKQIQFKPLSWKIAGVYVGYKM